MDIVGHTGGGIRCERESSPQVVECRISGTQPARQSEYVRWLSGPGVQCAEEAAPLLIELAENARSRRNSREAARYASLASEADPGSARALRLLLEHPLADCVKLGALVRLAKLEPADEEVAAQIAEIRAKYGLGGAAEAAE